MNRPERKRANGLLPSTLKYTLRKSPRAKHVRISVAYDGTVRITIPSHAPDSLAEKFLREKIDWVRAKQVKFAALNLTPLPKLSKRGVAQQKKIARVLVQQLVTKFATTYQIRPGKISIRNQRTRWGSCTKEGNLSFNVRIVDLTPELQEYIVVHELCHILEFNHSKNFWSLMARTIPNFAVRRKELRGKMM